MASKKTGRRGFLKGASALAGAAPIALAQQAFQTQVAQTRASAASGETGRAPTPKF